MPRARIIGTGHYVPERVVTNEEMAQRITTTDEWIQQRTGVKERRFVKEGQTPAELGANAARAALEAAGLQASDLDFIICATQTPEHMFPGTACYIQRRLETPGIGALDVRDQCTGFLYGLDIADLYVRTGKFNHVLLVGTEVHTPSLEYSDNGRHITVLFGDGAGAVVVGASDVESRGILDTELHADGRFADDLCVPAPGAAFQPYITHELLEKGLHYPKMNGKVVFKEAVSSLTRVVHSLLARNGLSVADVDYFIPHQANMRITEAVVKFAGLDPDRVDYSIQRYGNCAAASVPIALDETVRAGKIKEGDLVLLATFAAGFTWGATLMRW